MDAAVARKPWLKSYPPGVPEHMPALEFESIPRMFEASVARYREQPAFESFGVRITYADLDRLSRDFAAYLQSKLGLRKGDRVAVMMPNILQYPVAVFGILRAGLVVVSVNPLYTARELQHQLADSGATAIVIFESAAHTLQEIIARTPVRHVVVASVGDMLGMLKGNLINFVFRKVKKMVKPWSIPGAVRFPEALAQGGARSLSTPAIAADDLAFLQYTGGTTGVSKGAMLQHRHILANVQQILTYTGDTVRDSREIAIA
ncbi:MAG TPA: AMP-binding protein, partial [Burkholderiales bacterium]|nr:AMP-binding protein [Burkholderiales bacterium]